MHFHTLNVSASPLFYHWPTCILFGGISLLSAQSRRSQLGKTDLAASPERTFVHSAAIHRDRMTGSRDKADLGRYFTNDRSRYTLGHKTLCARDKWPSLLVRVDGRNIGQTTSARLSLADPAKVLWAAQLYFPSCCAKILLPIRRCTLGRYPNCRLGVFRRKNFAFFSIEV